MTEPVSTLVIGEGVAGQATALELARRGVPVLLLTRAPAEHAESVARQDGLDAALAGDDSPSRHLDDLIALSGEAARPFLEPLCEAAPEIVDVLGRLDVPFERTRKGELSLSQMTGSSRARSLHASSLTARHVSRRLSALLLRYEASGLVDRWVGWSVVDLVQDDDGHARGVVAQSFATGEHRAIRAHGICLASGGHAGLFSADTLAPAGLGALTGLAFRRGARLIAPDRVSFHPFCYRAGGFVRRLPRRLESMGAAIDAGLLDLSKLDRGPLRAAAGPALETYARTTGADPYSEPAVVTRAPDRTLGGLAISTEHATTVPGLFAVGGVVAAYFGTATSPGTPLVAALFGARQAARALASFRDGPGQGKELGARLEAAEDEANRRSVDWLEREGKGSTVDEVAADLRGALARELDGTPDAARLCRELDALEERARSARLGDDSPRANAALQLAWELEPAFALARGVARAIGGELGEHAIAHEDPSP